MSNLSIESTSEEKRPHFDNLPYIQPLVKEVFKIQTDTEMLYVAAYTDLDKYFNSHLYHPTFDPKLYNFSPSFDSYKEHNLGVVLNATAILRRIFIPLSTEDKERLNREIKKATYEIEKKPKLADISMVKLQSEQYRVQKQEAELAHSIYIAFSAAHWAIFYDNSKQVKEAVESYDSSCKAIILASTIVPAHPGLHKVVSCTVRP